MVQEELTRHEEEGEVVEEPAQDEEPAEAIVEDDLSCWSKSSQRGNGASDHTRGEREEAHSDRNPCSLVGSEG
jgi:hypothetical protein